MSLPDTLEHFRNKTAMYVNPVNYSTVTAFVEGYNFGDDSRPLRGFREWLVMQVEVGHNFHWPKLVLCQAFPHNETPWKMPTTPEANAEAIDAMFRLLAEFFDVLNENGLQSILDSHVEWKRQR